MENDIISTINGYKISYTCEKCKNEFEVPINGIVKNVGRNVPIIEPIVLSASSRPITLPETFSPKEYLISEGVTFPKNNKGGTKRIMHENNADQITSPLVTNKANKTETPAITNLPKKGTNTIHVPANSNSIYNLKYEGFLSA